jgi:hypothetical protein
MALRRGTFFDLPADLSLALFSFPISSSVILDGNGKIEGIRDVIGDGTLIARTADSTKRHTLAKINGFDSAYSADTNSNGILLTDYSKLPVGDAERHMTWVVVSQDGVVGGYRGGGRQYWIDNPFPDYRLRTNVADYTGSGSTNNSQLHGLSLNHRNISGATSRSQMIVDGSQRLDQPVTLNTSLGTYGIKGAELAYYTMKGNTVLHYIGKRAATVDEQYKIDSICQTYTGMTLPAGHPYASTPWMVDDGAGSATFGSSFTFAMAVAQATAIISANGASSASSIAIAAATATSRANGIAQAQTLAIGAASLTFSGAGVALASATAVAVGSTISAASGNGAALTTSAAVAQGMTIERHRGVSLSYALVRATAASIEQGVGVAYGAATAIGSASSAAIASGSGFSLSYATAVGAGALAMRGDGAAIVTASATASARAAVRGDGYSLGLSRATATGPAQSRRIPPDSRGAILSDNAFRSAILADTGPRRVTVS